LYFLRDHCTYSHTLSDCQTRDMTRTHEWGMYSLGAKIGMGNEIKRNGNIESKRRPRLRCCMAHFEWLVPACHIQEFINNTENTTQKLLRRQEKDGWFQVGERTKQCTLRKPHKKPINFSYIQIYYILIKI